MKYAGHSSCLTEAILFPEGGGAYPRYLQLLPLTTVYNVAYIAMEPVWIIKLVICYDASK